MEYHQEITGTVEVPAIEIESICRKILKTETLDVFSIILLEKEITKVNIVRRYMELIGESEGKVTKYRNVLYESIARLEGTMFIDYWSERQSHVYSLTDAGRLAAEIVGNLVEEDKELLKRSKVTQILMRGEATK